jgi:hypothetical protein
MKALAEEALAPRPASPSRRLGNEEASNHIESGRSHENGDALAFR